MVYEKLLICTYLVMKIILKEGFFYLLNRHSAWLVLYSLLPIQAYSMNQYCKIFTNVKCINAMIELTNSRKNSYTSTVQSIYYIRLLGRLFEQVLNNAFTYSLSTLYNVMLLTDSSVDLVLICLLVHPNTIRNVEHYY